MYEILVKNNLFEGIGRQNNGLFTEILFLNQCFDVLIEFQINLFKILSLEPFLKDLRQLSLEEIHSLLHLSQDFDTIIT